MSLTNAAANGISQSPQVLAASNFDPAQVERFLRLLGHGEAGGVTEIRILCEEPRIKINGREQYVGKTVSGYYDSEHLDQAARDLAPFDGKAAIYVTPNPVKPALLARAANRLIPAKHVTTDADILCRRWLLLDFDPVRPAGISASEPELEAALMLRDAVAADLETCGAQVLRGMSGNGGHALVRLLELPNDSDSRAQIERVLCVYSNLYSSDAVNVDTTVGNASRIWKCYGTTATKGDSTAERPHRRAWLDFPDTTPEPFDLARIPIEEPEPAPDFQSAATGSLGGSMSAPGSDAARYVLGALRRTVEKLAATPEGQKHNALLRAAHNLGGFIHTGEVTPEQVERELLAAVGSDAKSQRKDLATICDGLKTGQAKPHAIPERAALPSLNGHGPQVLGGTLTTLTTLTTPRFETFSFADMAKMPRPKWLVRGLLVEGIASILSADSGGFKSFFALEMALCVATGRPFHGREVKQGPVVYVAAEGFHTLPERAVAWAQVRGEDLPDSESFLALKVPVNVADAATVAAFAAQLEAFAPSLVILDTLSQCAAGANENDNGQMALFVAGMMALGQKLGAHVQVLHHNGKATGSFRGASSIKANVDAHISMERPEGDEQNTVFVRCEKQRGKPFEPFALRGSEIELPDVDEYGDPISTLVFEPSGDTVAAKSAKHPNAQRADKTRDALMAAFDAVEVEEQPRGVDGVRVGFWKEDVEKSEPPICSASSFWRYRTKLENDGVIVQVGTHNGSPVYKRKSSTLTTLTTLNESCESKGQDQEALNSHNSHNPLGVRVVRVRADGAGQDQTEPQPPGLFLHTNPPQQPGHKSSRAQSEPYAQHNGKPRKGGAL